MHPKTGRVCVPIDPSLCESFNPFSVPTLGHLENDMNAGATTSTKTSLAPYVEAFEKVVIALSLTLKILIRL